MTPTARHEELKQAGHRHLETLLKHFPEPAIRRRLSYEVGMKYNRKVKDSGFHFSHAPSIQEMEKAVLWLAYAADQKTLEPTLPANPKEIRQKRKLNQAELKAAVARIQERQIRKLPWWRRILCKVW